MPPSKILLGLALYGYVSKSTDKKLTGSFAPASIKPPLATGMHRRRLPDARKTPAMGDLSSMWGQQISFSQLISSGALVQNAEGNYEARNGYTMGMFSEFSDMTLTPTSDKIGWDNCSDTPVRG